MTRSICALRALGRFAIAGITLSGLGLLSPSAPLGAITGPATVPDRPLPAYSNLASPEAKKNWYDIQDGTKAMSEALAEAKVTAEEHPVKTRRIVDQYFILPGLKRLRTAFAVTIVPETMGGVQTDIVMPARGVAPENRNRVLINLHGGGMLFGARYGGQSESVPIAALGRIKVVTIDYRMAPEAKFPAASEDVASVYRELLKTYPAQNIGIYGCSSGADLAAQSVAWFAAHQLPRPGAVGMFGSGAGISDHWGDGYLIAKAFDGERMGDVKDMVIANAYLEGADIKSPLVTPAYFPKTLARFPPSLLLSGTRDVGLSVTAFTHAQLVAAGVEADLHVWEGAPHCSFAQGIVDPSVPETRQAWDVTVAFFRKHLGSRPASIATPARKKR